MPAECLYCPCLNVQVSIEKDAAIQEQDGDLIDGFPQASTSSAPRLSKLADQSEAIAITHDFLVSTLSNKTDIQQLRCINCSTTIGTYRSTGKNKESRLALPRSGQIALSPHLIAQDQVGSLKQEPSYSKAFDVVLNTSNAPSPSLDLSLYTPSPRQETSTSTSEQPQALQRTPSSSKSKDIQRNNPVLSALELRMTQVVRANRSSMEKEVAILRRSADLFAQRTKDEAEVLAQRGGVFKGFPSPASPTSPSSLPSPALRPILSPRRSQDSPRSIPTLSSDLDPSQNKDLASSVALSQGLQRMEKAASDRAEELRKEAEAKDLAEEKRKAEKAASAISPTPEEQEQPTSGKKVKFLEPEIPAGEEELAVEQDAGAEASVTGQNRTTDRDPHAVQDATMFNLDEELDEQNSADEHEANESPIDTSLQMMSSSADQLQSLEDAYETTQPAAIRSTLSAVNSEQTQKLRQLLGSDAPSHRAPSKRNRDGRQTPLSDIFESSHSPKANSSSSNLSSPSFASAQTEAKSVPISMAMRKRRDLDLPDLEQKTSVPDREALFVPPLRAGRRSPLVNKSRQTTHRPNVAEQLRQATEHAAVMSLQKENGFTNGSTSTPSAVPIQDSGVMSAEELFTPVSNPAASSFRGPSSLTAAFAARKPPPQPDSVKMNNEQEIEDGAENYDHFQEEGIAEGEEPSEFVPPHRWRTLTKGSESLLSTSVRDLRD